MDSILAHASNPLAAPHTDVLHELRLTHDRIVDLKEERDVYRELLQSALTALHHVTAERDRARAQLEIGREEFRQFRERVMFTAGTGAAA